MSNKSKEALHNKMMQAAEELFTAMLSRGEITSKDLEQGRVPPIRFDFDGNLTHVNGQTLAEYSASVAPKLN